ncbi:GLPGLI family protein, partial [Acinetobacter baumannii]|uniref:GLPGLI family protein n=1 Tax=Acinetobacter baumannii TaxID=470 RepID=UPI00399226EC
LDMVYLNLNDTAFRVTKRFYQTRLQILGKAIEIKWRITNEKKYIAGFECTRANGIYRDSIYTVAFFCSEITPPLGPLTFHGLPGMILGISLPSLHTSWYATRVY